MSGGGYASKQKVERLEQEVTNLRTAMERQIEQFIELREAVTPADPYNSFMANATAGSSPAVRNGRQFSG